MEKQKRKPRSYKIVDSAYNKAMKRAKKEKLELATMIEVWVLSYANGDSYFIDGLEPVKSKNDVV